jgi:hypothetical protein
MNDIVPMTLAPLAARDLRRAIRGVKGEAAIRATRVEAQTYIAHVGLQAVGMIAVAEEEIIKRAPLAEPRVKAIADLHAGVVASEVLRPW